MRHAKEGEPLGLGRSREILHHAYATEAHGQCSRGAEVT
jgi:hypothetical protein